MSDLFHQIVISTMWPFRRLLLAAIFAVALPSPATAATEAAFQSAGVDAAPTHVTPTGSLIQREKPKEPWKIVPQGKAVCFDSLLLGMPGAAIGSKQDAVRLVFLADMDRLSPFPVIESVVQLHQNPKVDLDLTLDRGRIDLIQRKKKGETRVRVRVRQEVWDLTLAEPGTSIALELYGRWPAGVPFSSKPDNKTAPTANLVFLVLRGQVRLTHGGFEHMLTAPPGPALIEWDSVTGQDASPHCLVKLPAWAKPEADKKSPEVKKRLARRQRVRQLLINKPVEAVVADLLHSDDARDREVAMYMMGALDDLARLGEALHDAKHPELWEPGVLALRHWIGRGPGQDQQLYQGLILKAKFSPVHAATVLQLLHSFGESDLANPDTYQMLIDFLDHEKLAIRGLACWHLCRLVPEGKKIGYQPQDPKAKREAAVEQWKKLIPPGKLPPRFSKREDK